jgi:spore coat polysaccharide biosynthesis protein SpsF
MGSTRLPGKVLLPLAGRPLVGHIVDRLRATPGVCAVVLATTSDRRNDPLVAFARDENIAVHREPKENDIASRLAAVVRLSNADAILKVNGDCPAVDPAIMAMLVARYADGDVDYVSNKIVWTWPEGLSAEVISCGALEWCDRNLESEDDRELVANWIGSHRNIFRVASVEGASNLTRYRLTVDTQQDYERMSDLFSSLWPNEPLFGIESVVQHLARRDGISAEDG